jgi:hypothetical protein
VAIQPIWAEWGDFFVAILHPCAQQDVGCGGHCVGTYLTKQAFCSSIGESAGDTVSSLVFCTVRSSAGLGAPKLELYHFSPVINDKLPALTWHY